jgi:hypothetical protein
MHRTDASAPNIEDNLLHEEFEKRAPMGFHGMRGKKDYLLPDFEDAYFRDDYEKRAASQDTKGRNSLLEDEYYKRAPMGFQGMRGKKSLEEVSLRRLNVIFVSGKGFQRCICNLYDFLCKSERGFLYEFSA